MGGIEGEGEMVNGMKIFWVYIAMTSVQPCEYSYTIPQYA